MWILLFGLTSGLLASSWANSLEEVKMRGCSFAGVFYIQGKSRYTLSFDQAKTLCEGLGARLASQDEMATAYAKGLETCRYGWIDDGNITIPRHTAVSNCAANATDLIIIKPTETTSDAFCYNATDLSDKNCDLKFNLGSAVLPEDDGIIGSYTTEDPSTTIGQDDIASTATMITTELETLHHETFTVSVNTMVPTEPGDLGDPDTTTEDDPENDLTDTDKPIDLIPALEPTGSGMGGQPDSETTQVVNKDTKLSTESDVSPDTEQDQAIGPTVHSKGRKSIDKPATAQEEQSDSHDWLVIVGVIAAVIIIILVCAAAATRKRWCGKRKTLMITSKSNSEGNGTAASAGSSRAQEREQEMVTLMNKEKIQENGNTEEFTVITLEESPEKSQQA